MAGDNGLPKLKTIVYTDDLSDDVRDMAAKALGVNFISYADVERIVRLFLFLYCSHSSILNRRERRSLSPPEPLKQTTLPSSCTPLEPLVFPREYSSPHSS